MPRRVVKPFKFEVELERRPLKPAAERRMLKHAVSRASKDMQEWHNAQTDEARFYAAPQAAIGAFNLSEYELAAKLAEQSLGLAESFRGNWNYGNALHFGHTVLGLLALRAGSLSVATSELQKSVQTPGSPQLNSFGPSMQLAKALLKAGATDPGEAGYWQVIFWGAFAPFVLWAVAVYARLAVLHVMAGCNAA